MSLKRKKIKKNEKKVKEKHFIHRLKDYLDLQYEFRKNVLTLEIEVRKQDEEDFYPLDESIINSLWIDLQIDGYKVSDATLLKILNSKLTPSYNPISEYFNDLPLYDGEDHIKALAETIEIADIQMNDINLRDLWEVYLKKWLVASVATILQKGVNHTCLILVGGQGLGKTTWLNKLCPSEMKEFLVCSHINPSLTDQNTANYLAEKWFVNIDDQLETIFGKDFNSMKAIITAPKVTNRKTWHKLTKNRPRICSFMGSVNNPKFLTDSQNRRYLVFTAENINFNHKVDIQQVWAQALTLAEGHYPFWFSPTELKTLNKINEYYRQTTPEEEWLNKLFQPTNRTNPKAKFMMPSEILMQLNIHSGMKMSLRKLSQAMNHLGYGEAVSKRVGDKGPRKVYPIIQHSHLDEEEWQSEAKEQEKSISPDIDLFS